MYIYNNNIVDSSTIDNYSAIDFMNTLSIVHYTEPSCIDVFKKIWSLILSGNNNYPSFKVLDKNEIQNINLTLIITFDDLHLPYLIEKKIKYKNFNFHFPLCSLTSYNELQIPLLYYSNKETTYIESKYYTKLDINLTNTNIFLKSVTYNKIDHDLYTKNILVYDYELNNNKYDDYDMYINTYEHIEILDEIRNMRELNIKTDHNLFHYLNIHDKVYIGNQIYTLNNGVYIVNSKTAKNIQLNNYFIYKNVIRDNELYTTKLSTFFNIAINDIVLDLSDTLYKVTNIVDNM